LLHINFVTYKECLYKECHGTNQTEAIGKKESMLSEDSDVSNSPGVEPSHKSCTTPGHPGDATTFSVKAAYIKEAVRAIEGHLGRNGSAAGFTSY
jgi:hypothetical protein